MKWFQPRCDTNHAVRPTIFYKMLLPHCIHILIFVLQNNSPFCVPAFTHTPFINSSSAMHIFVRCFYFLATFTYLHLKNKLYFLEYNTFLYLFGPVLTSETKEREGSVKSISRLFAWLPTLSSWKKVVVSFVKVISRS